MTAWACLHQPRQRGSEGREDAGVWYPGPKSLSSMTRFSRTASVRPLFSSTCAFGKCISSGVSYTVQDHRAACHCVRGGGGGEGFGSGPADGFSAHMRAQEDGRGTGEWRVGHPCPLSPANQQCLLRRSL